MDSVIHAASFFPIFSCFFACVGEEDTWGAMPPDPPWCGFFGGSVAAEKFSTESFSAEKFLTKVFLAEKTWPGLHLLLNSFNGYKIETATSKNLQTT